MRRFLEQLKVNISEQGAWGAVWSVVEEWGMESESECMGIECKNGSGRILDERGRMSQI